MVRIPFPTRALPFFLPVLVACSPGGSSGAGGGTTTSTSADGASTTSSSSSASTTSSTGSSSSSSGGCVPSAVEDCFNGLDDDCNGMTDCEDAACTPVAVCEPLPKNGASGVLVPETDPCPPGFTAEERLIYRGLQADLSCSGCGCTAGPTSCSGDVWVYDSPFVCIGDNTNSKGFYVGAYGLTCGDAPFPSSIVGARTSTWRATPSCNVNGPEPLTPVTWEETKKFCRIDAEGKGCSTGNKCVPKQWTAPRCALAPGNTTCPGFGMPESYWYTGVDDTRACTCSCTATGGDCNGVVLNIGKDSSCNPTHQVGENSRVCFNPPVSDAPVYLGGNPTSGTCTAATSTTGDVVPTGASTLCCQP